jgi:hypothetical protein
MFAIRSLLISAVLAVSAAAQTPLGTVFTYQGQLTDGGSPATGLHDLRFQLYDAALGGAQVGATLCFDGVNVVEGLFTVPLDFGAQFNNSRRFLDIGVRADATPGNCAVGVYTALSSRQELQGAPYALGVRLPLVETFDGAGNNVHITNNSTGRVLLATRSGDGGLSAIRADGAGDSALWGQGSTATAEGVTAISTGGADALDAQAQGTTGRAGDFAITNAANPGPALVAVTAGAGQAALLDGRVDIGASGSNTGELRIFASASANAIARARGVPSGANLDLFDEDGNFMAGFEADSAGTGGFAYVYRSTGSQGFTVDGNTGANEPRVSISGSVRSAVFDMADSGNDSVLLPTGAISSQECFDEPGVASNALNGGVDITSTALTIILSRTVNVPTAGYVLVLGTTQLEINHVNGTGDLYNIGVSDSSTALPANQDLFTTVIAALPTGNYQKVVSPHGLFVVPAGANTFYLLGEKTAATSDDAIAFDSQLTLVFFPTAYGTVIGTLRGGGDGPDDGTNDASDRERGALVRPPLTAEALAAEQIESIAANQARLLRELDEMRRQVESLHRQLAETMAAQQAAANQAEAPRPAPVVLEEGEPRREPSR